MVGQGPAPVSADQFGRYRLIAPIAAGGMAEVYLAEMQGPHGFQRQVALKRILPHLVRNSEFVQAFIDEARIQGHLTHPHIVQILDFDFVNDVPYIAMDYVEGGHLGSLLRRVQDLQLAMPAEYLHAFAVQIARGLDYAHSARDRTGRPLHIIHRDLKPSNLLLGLDAQVRIADFGIAKASSNLTHTMPDVLKGSLPYMSPEQASGRRDLTAASDIYAFGAIFYELVVGERLFDGGSPVELLGTVLKGASQDKLLKLQHLSPSLSRFVPLVNSCLCLDPSQRPSSFRQVLCELEQMSLRAPSSTVLVSWVESLLSSEASQTVTTARLRRSGYSEPLSIVMASPLDPTLAPRGGPYDRVQPINPEPHSAAISSAVDATLSDSRVSIMRQSRLATESARESSADVLERRALSAQDGNRERNGALVSAPTDAEAELAELKPLVSRPQASDQALTVRTPSPMLASPETELHGRRATRERVYKSGYRAISAVILLVVVGIFAGQYGLQRAPSVLSLRSHRSYILSERAGTPIFVNGELAGVTPLALDLEVRGDEFELQWEEASGSMQSSRLTLPTSAGSAIVLGNASVRPIIWPVTAPQLIGGELTPMKLEEAK